MASTSSSKDKKKVAPVQVYLRVRPTIPQDGLYAISNITPKDIQLKGHSRSFRFDGIFDANTSQARVYKTVVSSMISDVLKGYNCTVLAYGQTGTGKTHTILGSDDILTHNDGLHWTDSSQSGIIMRSIVHLYEELEKLDSSVQRTVTVSFMEIYNEEIRDLLPDKESSALRIYEDKSKLVRVKNLCEITVLNPGDIFKLLKKGCEKRQVASTLMNQHSSRSHSVFTINVSIIHNISVSEDLSNITTGKLNLVDLAGSENAARSGSKEMRAREATNINQSLLTLGRVIKALAENSSHVPYRESKLTRILQDSLGGKTKTAIIATISPGVASLEETINTLDYAFNAKHITNCPTINLRTSANSAAVQEELLRLKRDLFAMANEQGIYMDKENYEEMTQSLMQYKKDIVSKHEMIRNLTDQIEELESEKEQFENLKKSFEFTRKAYQDCYSELENKNNQIQKNELLIDHYEKQSEKFQEITKMLERRDLCYQEKVNTLYKKSRQNQTVLERIIETIDINLNAIIEKNLKNSQVSKQSVNSLQAFQKKVYQMLMNVKDKLLNQNDISNLKQLVLEQNGNLQRAIEISVENFGKEIEEMIDYANQEIENKKSIINSLDQTILITQLELENEIEEIRKITENFEETSYRLFTLARKEVNELNEFSRTQLERCNTISQKKSEIVEKKEKLDRLNEKMTKLLKEVYETQEEIQKCRTEVEKDEEIVNEEEKQLFDNLKNNFPTINFHESMKQNCDVHAEILKERSDSLFDLKENELYFSKMLQEVRNLNEMMNSFKEKMDVMDKVNENKELILSHVQSSNENRLEFVQNIIKNEMTSKQSMAGVISQIADIGQVQGKTNVEQLSQMISSNADTLMTDLQSTKLIIRDLFKNSEPVTSSGDTPVKLNVPIVEPKRNRDSILRNLTNEIERSTEQ